MEINKNDVIENLKDYVEKLKNKTLTKEDNKQIADIYTESFKKIFARNKINEMRTATNFFDNRPSEYDINFTITLFETFIKKLEVKNV